MSNAAPKLPLAPEAAVARVMVCDDSVVIRGAIARILESDPAIRVVARVGNGQLAIDELARQAVDVVVLDVAKLLAFAEKG